MGTFLAALLILLGVCSGAYSLDAAESGNPVPSITVYAEGRAGLSGLRFYDDAGFYQGSGDAAASFSSGWIIEAADSAFEITAWDEQLRIRGVPGTAAAVSLLENGTVELQLYSGTVRAASAEESVPILIRTPDALYEVRHADIIISRTEAGEESVALSGRAAAAGAEGAVRFLSGERSELAARSATDLRYLDFPQQPEDARIPEPPAVVDASSDSPVLTFEYGTGITGSWQDEIAYGLIKIQPGIRGAYGEFSADIELLRDSSFTRSFGSGLSGFPALMDITLSMFSLVQHAELAVPAGISLSAGSDEPYTLAEGLFISSLDPATDSPLQTRTPFTLTVPLGAGTAELFIDDLNYPLITAVRSSFDSLRFEKLRLGFSLTADIGAHPTYAYPYTAGGTVSGPGDLAGRLLLIPAADARLPLYERGLLKVDAFAGAGILLQTDKEGGFLSLPLISTHEQGSGTSFPYAAGAGAAVRTHLFSFRASAVSAGGGLEPGFMGGSYYMRRDRMRESLLDSGSDPGALFISLEAGYQGERWEAELSSSTPLSAPAETRLGLRLDYRTSTISFSTRASGTAEDFFTLNTAWRTEAGIKAGPAELTGELSVHSGSIQGYALKSSIGLLPSLAASQGAIGALPELSVSQGIIGDLAGGVVYAAAGLSQRLSTERVSAAASLKLIYDGNPLYRSHWYASRGNDPLSFGSGFSDTGLVLLDSLFDLLQLVDEISVRDREGEVFLEVGTLKDFTLGEGGVIDHLNPSQGTPLIHRVPLRLQFKGAVSTEVFIDDITYPAVTAFRTAFGEDYQAGVGVTAELGRFTASSYPLGDTAERLTDLLREVLVRPEADLRIPLARGQLLDLDLISAVALLTAVDEQGSFDTSYIRTAAEGFTNFTIKAGVSGRAERFSASLGGSLSRGSAFPGQIGRAYYAFRDTQIQQVLGEHDPQSSASAVHGELEYRAEVGTIGIDWDIPFSAWAPLRAGVSGTVRWKGLQAGVSGYLERVTASSGVTALHYGYQAEGTFREGGVLLSLILSGQDAPLDRFSITLAIPLL